MHTTRVHCYNYKTTMLGLDLVQDWAKLLLNANLQTDIFGYK